MKVAREEFTGDEKAGDGNHDENKMAEAQLNYSEFQKAEHVYSCTGSMGGVHLIIIRIENEVLKIKEKKRRKTSLAQSHSFGFPTNYFDINK